MPFGWGLFSTVYQAARVVNKMFYRDASIPGIYAIFILLLFKVISSDLVVNTDSGPVQGTPSLEEDVEAFLGIPYAEPPVGELRFAKPVPKTDWNDVYYAQKLPPPCVQSTLEHRYYFSTDVSNMSEDCLYLNIWVPKSEPVRGLRPVIIFFHQGAYVTGSSNFKIHDGSRLASRGDIVVVTINYRLGTLGFLITEIEEAEGSMGMYDQIMAIKWMRRNAKAFSGDPENIVLMGESAGASSVSAHMVSPLSKNLFNKAIVQSGSLLNPMFENNARLHESSESVASIVGCANETTSLKSDPRSVLKCLKGKSIEEFAAAEEILLKLTPTIFYPRINDPFLPKKVADLIREGHLRKDVKLLAGSNEDEGTLFLTIALRDYVGYYGRNGLKMSRHRAAAFLRTALFQVGQSSNTSEVVEFYVGNVKEPTSTNYAKAMANVFGDFGVICGTVFLADFASLNENAVYYYNFGFRSPSTPMAQWVGVTHLEELQYVLGNPYHDNFTSEETELSHRLMDRWSAFARTGDPNIAGHVPWLQYSYQNPLYLNFGQEEESIRLKPNDRCEFWRKKFDSELIQFLGNSEVDL